MSNDGRATRRIDERIVGPLRLADDTGDSPIQRVGGIAKVSDDGGTVFQPLCSRTDLLRSAQGVISETVPHWHCQAGIAPGLFLSGTLYLHQIYLLKGDVLANALVQTAGTGGASVTFAKIGLYDTAGNLLAATADQGAGAWISNGMHSQAFLSPYTVPTSGIYFIGQLVLHSGTYPPLSVALSPNAAKIGMADPVAGKPVYEASIASLSDLPSPATIATGTLPGLIWIGVN